MIGKITFTEERTDFDSIAKKSFIDVTKTIERPPIALSIGSYHYKGDTYPIPFGSYGDFSCIVGASKSMKTFLKTAIVAGYIGGQSTNYFSEIKGHDTNLKYVIDIDTEQSTFHTQKMASRVCEMVGDNYKYYKPFSLRSESPTIRFQFIEWIFMESPFRDNLGLVSVDGAADLLDNVNDLEASNNIVNSMLKWTKEKEAHLITVLHRNHGGMKPTGHLGSAITKKAESVAFVHKDEGEVKVTPEYTRNYPFNEFSFVLNDRFLPEETNKF